MSEPPKKSRNKKKDVQLVVSCEAPKVGVADGRSTSVYEIDIQGGYDFFKGGRKECIEKALVEPSTKDLPKELRGVCQEKVMEEVVVPRLEAHYPKLMETISAEQRPSRTHNASFMVQREILADGNKEKERKHYTGKTNKKRQAMPADAQRKFRKQIKNYIIENFIGDKCNEIKGMVQDYSGVLDGNEVHLHHHEHHHHHHHYYTNGKALENEIIPQAGIKENLNEPSGIFVATMTSTQTGGAMKNQEFEVDKTHHCHGSCHPQVPIPTEEPIGGPGKVPVYVQPSEEAYAGLCDPSFQEESTRSDGLLLEEEGSVAFVNSSNMSSKIEPSSVSSFKSRTSESDMVFIKNPDCSADSVMTENFEVRGIKVEKNRSSKSYTSLVDNFKSFSHFMSPIVITDQKTVPKILYIRCECSPWKGGMGTREEVETSQNESSEEVDDPGRMTDDGRNKERPGTEQSTNSAPNQSHGLENESSDELEFEVWTSRLKKELQEIKKELKRIEEKQVLEKRSTNTSFRKDKLSECCSDNQITVYSSKTFIMQPPEKAAADV